MQPDDAPAFDVIDPYEEVLAYEYLYSGAGSILERVSEATAGAGLLPSET